jgi:alkanesulfonate monooxygenase SsuD/methylene tetrahydromethanopterin reductase-like flavin-dependent oxidoreductase (luciferase family)
VLSRGRLTLGLAVGGREDDYTASGIDFHQRGKLFDRQLEDLRRFWGGEKVGFAGAIGPQPPAGRPKVVIGGRADAVFRRAAQFDGWMMGGGPPQAFSPEIVKLNAAWAAAGREGEPRRMALGYYGLGPGAREQVHSYITGYYGFLGPEASEGFAASVPTEPAAIKELVEAFAAVGCDEFILFPTSADAAQVNLLAEAVL